jgi:Family of unknown function (DUF5399)
MAGLEISNLPQQVVYDYESTKKLLEEIPNRDVFGFKLPPKTDVQVTEPSYANELSKLLDLGKERTIWALFTPPPGYQIGGTNLFSLTVIPYLTQDKIDAHKERIQGASKTDFPAEFEWERAREVEDENVEKERLISCLDQISLSDRDLNAINNERYRYHKG